MKNSIKILAILFGIMVFVSSCQKDELPVPAGSDNAPGSVLRTGDPSTTDDGNDLNGGDGPVSDSIVGGGDDDRDGGGVVGGGDGDHDGGKKENPGGK